MSANDNIEQRVTQLIAEQIGIPVDDVTGDKHLVDDLDADSLDTIELVMLLEEEFEIEITDAEAEKVQTVGDAIAAVKARLQK